MYALAARVQTTGRHVLRYGLALVIAWIGALKFTAAEAKAIEPLAGNSPLLSWTYSFLSLQGFSNTLGAVEIAIAAMIAAGPLSVKLAAIGGVLSVMMFLTTLSFLFTTPGMFEPSLAGFPAPTAGGAFVLKDVVLLGGALCVLGEALEKQR